MLWIVMMSDFFKTAIGDNEIDKMCLWITMPAVDHSRSQGQRSKWEGGRDWCHLLVFLPRETRIKYKDRTLYRPDVTDVVKVCGQTDGRAFNNIPPSFDPEIRKLWRNSLGKDCWWPFVNGFLIWMKLTYKELDLRSESFYTQTTNQNLADSPFWVRSGRQCIGLYYASVVIYLLLSNIHNFTPLPAVLIVNAQCT